MEHAAGTTQVRPKPVALYNNEPHGIVKYSNRIQGFAYGGAAALVVIIGLRSVYGRAIPSWVVISGLCLEACLLMMIATVYYLTPEEKGGGQPSTSSKLLDGEKEILSLLRDHVLRGESEILNVLRNDLLGTQKEMVSVLRNDLLAGQKDITLALQKETESRTKQQQIITAALQQEGEARTKQQQQLVAALQKESDQRAGHQEEVLQALNSNTGAVQQQSLSLVRIDEQITMLLKNEVDNIVQMKVQQIFTGLIRAEADSRIEQELSAPRNGKHQRSAQ